MNGTYHRFLGGAAVTLGVLVAVMLVNGGWQPVAAVVGILGGLIFLLSFIRLAAASERPPPARPAWAREAERVPAVPAARPAPAPAPAAEAAPAAPARPVRGRLSSAPS